MLISFGKTQTSGSIKEVNKIAAHYNMVSNDSRQNLSFTILASSGTTSFEIGGLHMLMLLNETVIAYYT